MSTILPAIKRIILGTVKPNQIWHTIQIGCLLWVRKREPKFAGSKSVCDKRSRLSSNTTFHKEQKAISPAFKRLISVALQIVGSIYTANSIRWKCHFAICNLTLLSVESRIRVAINPPSVGDLLFFFCHSWFYAPTGTCFFFLKTFGRLNEITSYF